MTRQILDDVVVFSAIGAIDMFTISQFEREISLVLERRPAALIIDLSKVYFLASVGVGALVAIRTTYDQMRYVLVTDGPATRRPLELLSIDSIISVYSTVPEALSDVKR